ncbi:MAG: hypothetical protein WCP11_01290 [Candidatus Saccharibacteria bacterium]
MATKFVPRYTGDSIFLKVKDAVTQAKSKSLVYRIEIGEKVFNVGPSDSVAGVLGKNFPEICESIKEEA